MITTRMLISLVIALISTGTYAQRYILDKGHVTLFSEAPIENISANNKKIDGIFVPSIERVAFVVVVKDFEFTNKLMQEHFNDKYMESYKFPMSNFSGRIIGFSENKEGIQSVRAVGKLTIHGITREIDVPGTVEVEHDSISMKSKFKILLKDYNIEIPKLLWKNISEDVELTIDLTYKKQ